jgi:hypothetical protein
MRLSSLDPNHALIQPEHPDFAAIEAFQREQSGQSVRDWGEDVFLYENRLSTVY